MSRHKYNIHTVIKKCQQQLKPRLWCVQNVYLKLRYSIKVIIYTGAAAAFKSLIRDLKYFCSLSEAEGNTDIKASEWNKKIKHIFPLGWWSTCASSWPFFAIERTCPSVWHQQFLWINYVVETILTPKRRKYLANKKVKNESFMTFIDTQGFCNPPLTIFVTQVYIQHP